MGESTTASNSGDSYYVWNVNSDGSNNNNNAWNGNNGVRPEWMDRSTY